MKKGICISFFIFLALLSCRNVDGTKSDGIDLPDNHKLSAFMIGTWIGNEQVTDIHGSYNKEYKIEFIDENNLIFQMRSPYDGFNDRFVYRFIKEDTLLVENERAKDGEWGVTREEEDLMICIWTDTNCVRFKREN